MADITYCMNTCCPFTDCERHSDNAPRGIPVSCAWLDGTCRRYIGWLVDEVKESKGCEYCTEYKELPEHCLNDGQDVGRIFDTCIQETNQGWHIELPSSFDIGIRFCPMCGRRLEEV